MSKKRIGIIVFGRFGQLLASILSSDFIVQVYDCNAELKLKAIELNIEFVPIDKLLQAETIFYCVPISSLKEAVIEHLPIYKKMNDNKTIIDVLSIKNHPKEVFEEFFPANYQILLTHPMFGPDGVKAKGLSGQSIVIDKYRTSAETFAFWRQYFIGKKLNIIEMTTEEHDSLIAQSQGLAHLIGRILDDFGFKSTAIDTIGAKKLHEIKEQTCNDTWQLFFDLQRMNPHAKEMRSKLASAFDNVLKRIEQY